MQEREFKYFSSPFVIVHVTGTGCVEDKHVECGIEGVAESEDEANEIANKLSLIYNEGGTPGWYRHHFRTYKNSSYEKEQS